MSFLQHHSLGNHTSWQLTTNVTSLSSSASWSPRNVSPCNLYILHLLQFDRNMWVLVATTCRVIRLWIEEKLPIWKVSANILNKPSRTADIWRSNSFVLCEELTNPYLKKKENCFMKQSVTKPQTWTDSLVQRKCDVIFGTKIFGAWTRQVHY